MAEREATGKGPPKEAATDAEKSLSKIWRRGLAKTLVIERTYTPDRDAMLAALRIVLGLPKAPPQWLEELGR